MKSNYMKPSTSVVTLTTTVKMLDTSISINGKTSDSDDLLSRRRGNGILWDDDEEQ